MSLVHYCKKTKPSALALREKLTELGYNGPEINYGYGHREDALNRPESLRMACNKREALFAMQDAGISVPALYATSPDIVENEFPVVGRPDQHSKGRGFWLCHNEADVQKALRGTRLKKPATHFLEYIEGAREFRVHVFRDGRQCNMPLVNDDECPDCKYRSIKISEKIGEIDAVTRNHSTNVQFIYGDITPSIRKKLRKAAREAVKALGLDFGAADILLKGNKVYVLEVNTAPRLTDETADTLDKYVDAFMRYWNV